MMRYPSLTDYQAALWHPEHVFADPELQACQPVKDPLGLPQAISGGFALTFHVRAQARAGEWAVRCFQKADPDRARRYQAITSYLPRAQSDCLVPFSFQPEGMIMPAGRFPLVKMAWVPGQTLGAYVERHVGNPGRLQAVLSSFHALAAELESSGIAHGDLDDSNILVTSGPTMALRLVDYDGMYVPGMPPGESTELGHTNYQSALRDEHTFGPYLDRFAMMVIALALEALAVKPDLWRRYAQDGENLLFEQKDFRDPETSPLLGELRALPSLAARVEQFTLLCRTPLPSIPTLADFTRGAARNSADVRRSVASGKRQQYPIVDAREKAVLLGLVGQRVQVVGHIMTTRRGEGPRPYAFLNFGRWQEGAFYLVLWAETVERLKERTQPVESFAGSWVSATGLVQEFVDKDGQRKAQIVLEDARHMRRLAGEKEARALLEDATQRATGLQPLEPARLAPPRMRPARQAMVPLTGARGGGLRPAGPASRPRATTPPPAALASRNQAALAAINLLSPPAYPGSLPPSPTRPSGAPPIRGVPAPQAAPSVCYAAATLQRAPSPQTTAASAESAKIQRNQHKVDNRRLPATGLALRIVLVAGGGLVLMTACGAWIALLVTLTLGAAVLLLV